MRGSRTKPTIFRRPPQVFLSAPFFDPPPLWWQAQERPIPEYPMPTAPTRPCPGGHLISPSRKFSSATHLSQCVDTSSSKQRVARRLFPFLWFYLIQYSSHALFSLPPPSFFSFQLVPDDRTPRVGMIFYSGWASPKLPSFAAAGKRPHWFFPPFPPPRSAAGVLWRSQATWHFLEPRSTPTFFRRRSSLLSFSSVSLNMSRLDGGFFRTVVTLLGQHRPGQPILFSSLLCFPFLPDSLLGDTHVFPPTDSKPWPLPQFRSVEKHEYKIFYTTPAEVLRDLGSTPFSPWSDGPSPTKDYCPEALETIWGCIALPLYKGEIPPQAFLWAGEKSHWQGKSDNSPKTVGSLGSLRWRLARLPRQTRCVGQFRPFFPPQTK